MWWRRIELKNYRSIESVRADIAPFTVLVGPNGSGKSNFADAFVFISELGDAATAVTHRGGIPGLQRWQRSPNGEISLVVRIANSRENLDQTYTHYEAVISVDKQKRWRFGQELFAEVVNGATAVSFTRKPDNTVYNFPNNTQFPPLTETASIALFVRQFVMLRSSQPVGTPWTAVQRCRLSPSAMRQPHTDSNNIYLNESGSNIAEALQSLRERKDGSFEDVLTALARIVPGLVELETNKVGHFRTLEFSQRQASGGVASFTALEMSDGALRALGILVAARQAQPSSMLIIEEPEVHLHPGAASVLFDALKNASQRCTVLITTHSPELLDVAQDEEILVCDNQQGATRIGPLANEQRQLVREGLFSAAELMRTTSLRIEGDAPSVIER
jgi:type I restriction enzyme M protein